MSEPIVLTPVADSEEPSIIVNGVQLTSAQASTVRVALSSFLVDIAEGAELAAALGDIAERYREHGGEVERLMLRRGMEAARGMKCPTESESRALYELLRARFADGSDLRERVPLYTEADAAMHRLWTWAVGLPGYDKERWKELEKAIQRLAAARGPA